MDQINSLEQQAVDLARRSDFGVEAKRVNEELARLAPANAGAWTRLGRCCMELGLLDEAVAALDAALQINPQNTIARSLQMEVTRRRVPVVSPTQRAKRASPSTPRAPREPRERTSGAARKAPARGVPLVPGWGRQEFTNLGHLAPEAALEALGPRIEAILMAVADRPFAAKVVEARNRAGQSGFKLYRRGTFKSGGPGHIFALQHGGQWEPQINIGFFSARQWGRDAVRAGIGFTTLGSAEDDAARANQERVLEYYENFRRLISSTWRHLLTDWLRANGGFIQYDGEPPMTDLLPGASVESLIAANPREHRWIFCGRWLFADRSEDVGTISEGPRLVRWIDQTFTDLLPLWMTVYRS